MSNSPYQPRRLVVKVPKPASSGGSPYQPRKLPVESIQPAKELKSRGYPSPDPWIGQFKTAKEVKEAYAILNELGIENNAVDFVKLLKDEKRLDEVVRKLKLKAFW